ncbi:IS4 family transposase, partial [Microcoleus sp. T3_B1]
MIPELYHAHLSEKLTRSNYLVTILLIQVVQSIKEVTLETIATKLAIPINFESRKKSQRFLSENEWSIDNIWLPLVIGWIKG